MGALCIGAFERAYFVECHVVQRDRYGIEEVGLRRPALESANQTKQRL